MLDTIWRYCEKENLIEKGDSVLAGVSGGADSVCLLLLLGKLQRQMEFSLRAVHVEHGIRGSESEADAVFVEKLCQSLEIPLDICRVDVPAFARARRLGTEEAARNLRYDCYVKTAKKIAETGAGKVKVALAHHADDNAETILFQMIRGSGIDGLCGILPRRELKEGVEVIRPLLCVARTEIEQYLKACRQDYCIDSTNADVIYSRNRIRRKVLPVLTEINAQAVLHINQSAGLLRELGDYVKGQVEICAASVLVEKEAEICVLAEPFLRLPEILKKELLHLALTKAAEGAKDVGARHICLLEELFSLQAGRTISLPRQVTARRTYEGIVLKKAAEISCAEDVCIELSAEKMQEMLAADSCMIEVPGGRIQFSLLENTGQYGEILKKTYTKCMDYDKMKGSFQIRTRRPGDYLVIDDAGHKKSLKEYFINEKIPAEQRDKMLLFTMADKVLWIIGCRMSADVKISSETRKILKVRITGGMYHEN